MISNILSWNYFKSCTNDLRSVKVIGIRSEYLKSYSCEQENDYY